MYRRIKKKFAVSIASLFIARSIFRRFEKYINRRAVRIYAGAGFPFLIYTVNFPVYGQAEMLSAIVHRLKTASLRAKRLRHILKLIRCVSRETKFAWMFENFFSNITDTKVETVFRI